MCVCVTILVVFRFFLQIDKNLWLVVNAKTHATELFVARLGLFGQVITVVCAPRGHISTLNCFKVLRLNSKPNKLHTQWTAVIMI